MNSDADREDRVDELVRELSIPRDEARRLVDEGGESDR